MGSKRLQLISELLCDGFELKASSLVSITTGQAEMTHQGSSGPPKSRQQATAAGPIRFAQDRRAGRFEGGQVCRFDGQSDSRVTAV